MPVALFSSLCADGTLWVAVCPTSMATPVAFLAAERLDEHFHIMQVSVAKSFQRQKLGTRLIQMAEDYARREGYPGLSLTTDKKIPWNGPVYSRMGFQEVEAELLGINHVQRVMEEKVAGLPVDSRCVMVKALER